MKWGLLDWVLYVNLAIDPFLGPCYCLSIAYAQPQWIWARAHGSKRSQFRPQRGRTFWTLGPGPAVMADYNNDMGIKGKQ